LAPSFDGLSIRELVQLTGETWREVDGRQKIHFSTQAPGKRPGAHADAIDTDSFRELVDEVGDLPLDCMLEVKDKEQSVLRAKELVGSAILRPSDRAAALYDETPPPCQLNSFSRPAVWLPRDLRAREGC
jgi:UV DNA damage repair endonuclease